MEMVRQRTTRRQFLWGALLALPALSAVSRSWGALSEFSLPSMDLGYLEPRMKLVRRWEWSQTPPRTNHLRDGGSYDRITVHHTGADLEGGLSAESVGKTLEGILVGHIEKGYGDLAYHFAIDRSGSVWEGRSLAYEGAHVAGQNERNVGVVVLGNFEHQTPSREQIAALDALVAGLSEHYRIRRHRIYGHRDLAASACPGKNLYTYAQRLRA